MKEELVAEDILEYGTALETAFFCLAGNLTLVLMAALKAYCRFVNIY